MDILWIGTAFVFGAAVSRFRIPPLVGYLLAGLVLSAFGYESGEMLQEIAHLGVIFLLFTVGLHIRVRNIFQTEVLGTGIVHLLISTLLFYPVALFFEFTPQAALIISVTLGFSSTVLAARNLEMRGEMGAYYGRVAIGVLIIQDLVAIAIMAYTGGGSPSPWTATLLAVPLIRPLIVWMVEVIRKDELVLLFGLVLAIGGASLFELFNVSGELGALMAGMMLAAHEKGESVGKKLWSIKEVFLVGFFLDIGLIGFPSGHAFQFIGVLIFLLPLKLILFFLLFMSFRLKARTGYLAAVSLTAYSEFTLIAGTIAAENGFIPESAVIVLGLLTAISFVANALIANWEDPVWKRMESWLSRFERDVKHPDREIISLGAAEYLIIGMGSAGRAAYNYMKDQGKQVVGMDIDPDRIESNLKSGRRVVYGDIQDTRLWQKVDLTNICSIIIAMGNREVKVNAVKAVRDIGYKRPIYVITMREDESEDLEKAGANSVSIPIKQAGERLAALSISNEDPSSPVVMNPESSE